MIRSSWGRRSLSATAAALIGFGCLAPATAGRAVASSEDGPTFYNGSTYLPVPGVDDLPAPFDDWHVQLRPSTSEEGALTLSYDSPALGQRTDNSVYLPNSYTEQGAASPVMYYLHGTVISYLDNPLLAPLTSFESLLDMVGTGGGYKQTLLEDFPSQVDNANFIVVAPDTDPADSWCETCLWIDGKEGALQLPPITARTVQAETVLMKEIIPLTEALLNARTDRKGRGIMGFSMGAVGAWVQGFRHPDKFSYIGALSGPFDLVDDLFWRGWLDMHGYFRDQGYGTSFTNTADWRKYNPKDLAKNLRGWDGHLLISAGDTCLAPTDTGGAADCAKYPPLLNPAAAFGESQMRRSADASVGYLESIGVNAQQFRSSGIHGANNHRVYSQVIVPTANEQFSQ